MTMPSKLHTALSEKLGDAVYKIDGEEKKLLDIITADGGWYDKFEASVKIQKANEDIKAEREQLKEKVKTIKTEFDTVKTSISDKDKEIERLQTSQLSDEDKQKLEKLKANNGMTDEAQAKVNALQDKFDTLTGDIKILKEDGVKKDEAVKLATINKKKESLRLEVITALTEKGIVGDNTKLALNDILAEGYAKLSDPDESGNVSNAFYIKKGSTILAAETAAEMAEAYAVKNESLVSSSKNTGTGNNHSSNGNGATFDWGKASTDDVQGEFLIKTEY